MIGKPNSEILEAILETLPVEFSVVDKNDNVVAWNKHKTRIFKRPEGVVGQNVKNCHPKNSLDKVEKILEEMKAGTRQKARFWIDLTMDGQEHPQKVLIEYYALRNADEEYLGCIEASQNITEIQQLTGQQRLLD